MSAKKVNNKAAIAFEEERERMHRQMFSAVSHDLKTPLASMIGALEIYGRMKAKLSDDKKEQLIATALQEAYRLDNFVTNILDMAKLESGMVKPHHESFNLGSSLRDCLVNLQNRLKGSDVTINALSGDLQVTGDPALLCRAVSLVLDNSVKYGGTPSVIVIDYGTAQGECYISIRDQGTGVPKGQEENIFQKYTRFVKSDHQNAGTGLGLAICRQIMHVLGGSISMHNSPTGVGSVFTLRFPLSA